MVYVYDSTEHLGQIYTFHTQLVWPKYCGQSQQVSRTLNEFNQRVRPFDLS